VALSAPEILCTKRKIKLRHPAQQLNASWRQRHRPGGDRVAAGGFEGDPGRPRGRERAGRSTTVRSSQPSRGAPRDRRSAAVAAAVRRGVLRVDGHNGHGAVGCYEQAESRKDEKLFHGCPLSVRRQPCHGLAASHVTESTGCRKFQAPGRGAYPGRAARGSTYRKATCGPLPGSERHACRPRSPTRAQTARRFARRVCRRSRGGPSAAAPALAERNCRGSVYLIARDPGPPANAPGPISRDSQRPGTQEPAEGRYPRRAPVCGPPQQFRQLGDVRTASPRRG
jgi:hypothetical protein